MIDYSSSGINHKVGPQQEISDIKSFEGVAKSRRPVIALSQLCAVSNAPAIIVPSQTSESGATEQMLTWCFVYRDEVYNKDDE